MHLRRARALVGLLTLQAGLLAYGGARVARAFMEQSPTSGESRAFTTPEVALDVNRSPAASAPAPAAPSKGLVLQEIVDPWQMGRDANRALADGLIDPWRDTRTSGDDPELVDPWRDARVASLDTPIAAFDWDTSPPELLNPWPTAVAPPGYELNELIDPWSTR
ncbi:MAG TPA: hypothetical protein VHO25_08150 [Polyangiaceae bacterium]|nr:hypothetical protein [Polyangiaceae bacterium]